MSEYAIKVKELSKIYKLYDEPIDRLKESLHPFKKVYHKIFDALKDVSFEIVVAVMKELQRRWQITPFLAEIVSGQSAGMVDMLITFKQEK